jgi:hypothetical protein
MKKNLNNKKRKKILIGFIFIEVILFLALFSSIILPSMNVVFAIVGNDNVTAITQLQVGNAPPEIINITIEGGAVSFDLTPNATTTLDVYITAKDYNGEGQISNITLTFFDTVASSYGGADDNNNHYTNTSCTINTGYGDAYEVESNCTLEIWYYANNATWNLTTDITDDTNLKEQKSSNFVVNTLLALGIPTTIDYGLINATEVSNEIAANVTNFGNVQMNLSLEGYGSSPGDNLSMNCTLGSVKNISIDYEMFNLTASNPGALTLNELGANYTNITSSTVVKKFDLNYRQNDGTNEAVNTTYWRMYVPLGVAGNCSGNIVFGAVQSAGS